MTNKQVFKQCPMCSLCWSTREDFLRDRNLELTGYQVDFSHLEQGLFLFTHKVEQCCSTLAVQAENFVDLYAGPVYRERKTGGDECPGYCLHREILDRCDAACECAYVREIIHLIKSRKQTRDRRESEPGKS